MPIEGISMTTVFSLVAVGIALALSTYLGGYYLRPIFEIDTLMASVAYDIAAIYDIAYTMPGEVTVKYFGPSLCAWNYRQPSDQASSFHCIDARTVLIKDVIVNKQYLLLYNDPYIQYDYSNNQANPLISSMGASDLSEAVSSRKPTHLYVMIPYFNRQVKYQTDIQAQQIFYGSLATAPIAASFTDMDVLQDHQTPSSVTVKDWAFEVTKRRVGTYYYTLAQNPQQPEELTSFIDFAISVYNNICEEESPISAYYGYNKPNEKISYADLFTGEENIINEAFSEAEDYFLRLYKSTRIKAYNSNLSKIYDSWSFDKGVYSDIGKNDLIFNVQETPLSSINGLYKNAYEFNGENYLKTRSSHSFDEISVSMWVKPFTDSSNRVLFSISDFELSINAENKLSLKKGGATLLSNQIIRRDVWNNIIASYNGTSLKIYRNGELISQLSAGNEAISGIINIGSSSFTGIIDDAKIFKEALTDAEARLIYSTVPGNYLCQEVLTYTPNIGSFDKSTYFMHGFLHDEDYYSRGVMQITNDGAQHVAEDSRDSYSFASANSVTAGQINDFDLQEFSISLWFKPNQGLLGVSHTLISKFSDWNGYVLYLNQAENRKLTFLTSKKEQGQGSEEYYILESSTTISPGNWYHAVATFNGTHSALYINGALESIIPSQIINDASTIFNIGGAAWSDGLGYNGLMHDLRVFDRALNIEEINILYSNPESSTNLFLNNVKLNDYNVKYCFDLNDLQSNACPNIEQVLFNENFINVINNQMLYYASWNSCIKPFIFYNSTSKKLII
ncbi:MAG: LamG domain-containing protein, partial [Candidatus Nanoarchaeia archaeon]|nr:LamG domain-containing protein [Candidatus Nanoarchaeia archaeon]